MTVHGTEGDSDNYRSVQLTGILEVWVTALKKRKLLGEEHNKVPQARGTVHVTD